jgi:hypothetical protein
MVGVWRHHHGDAATGVADEQQQYVAEALKATSQGSFSSDAIEIDDNDADDLDRLVSQVYMLEMHREELRIAERLRLDEAIATSLADAEERKLLGQLGGDGDDEEDSDLVIISASDLESKPAPSCTCCLTKLDNERSRRVLPCGHLYCLHCITTRAGMSVRDRTLLPAHCCRKEFPIDYVKEALKPTDFALYERFLKEKHWTLLDLESDKEYAHAAKQNGCKQCPGCGIGVSRISGCDRMKCCNGHEFCFGCGKAWKTCPCYYPGGGY